MHQTKTEGKARPTLSLLIVVGVLLSALLLAACGSSSTKTSSGGASAETTSTASKSAEPSSGAAETTVYAKGVPTLKELYASSNEPPPTSGPPAAKGKTVVWVSCGQAAIGCAIPANSFLEAAKALGWKASIADGKLNVGNGYATAIHTAIASHPDAIIGFGIGCAEAKTPYEEVKAAGIPVVETQNIDCNDPRANGPSLFKVKNLFTKKAKSAAEFYESYGRNQAAYVVDRTKGKAKVLLTEFVGLLGKSIGNGWKSVFQKCAECKILANVQWEAAEQRPAGPLEQKFVTTLTKYPEANAAIVTFDSTATYGGLAKAIVDAGRAHNMLVVSGEGFNETLELVREEKGITAEAGAWDNKWAGWEAADELNRYFNGQPSVPEGVGVAVIDKEHNMLPKGQNYFSGIDFAKSYEEIWSGKTKG